MTMASTGGHRLVISIEGPAIRIKQKSKFAMEIRLQNCEVSKLRAAYRILSPTRDERHSGCRQYTSSKKGKGPSQEEIS